MNWINYSRFLNATVLVLLVCMLITFTLAIFIKHNRHVEYNQYTVAELGACTASYCLIILSDNSTTYSVKPLLKGQVVYLNTRSTNNSVETSIPTNAIIKEIKWKKIKNMKIWKFQLVK